MRRYALRDDQWDRIKDILPGREGHVGGTAADNRLFVEAVLFRFRAGVPWRDLPERFGDWKIVYQRFNRWAKSGVFEGVFRLLASDHDSEYMMIDATIVRAHQHSAGGQKKTARKPSADPAADRPPDSRARRRPRQSCRGDAQPGPGSRSDLRSTAHRCCRSRRLDRRQAYDADAFIAALDERAIVPVIPSKSNRKTRARATSSSTANATSWSVFSTSSSISAPSPPVTTSSPRFSSPPFTSPAPQSSSTEHTP